MAEVAMPLDPARVHTWTATWGGGRTVIGCEGVVLRDLDQSSDHPPLLMVDLFEIGPPGGAYPKTAGVHHVRGWSDPASS